MCHQRADVDDATASCDGAGACQDAAALCPSFYRADVVRNPRAIERWLDETRQLAIEVLRGNGAGHGSGPASP